MTFALITAAEAKDLAHPTEAEEYARYLLEVDEAIREAALAQVSEIVVRVPIHLRDRLLTDLANTGYNYVAQQNIEQMSFFRLSWN